MNPGNSPEQLQKPQDTTYESPSLRPQIGDLYAIFTATAVLYVLTSVAFALIFEWDRYAQTVNWHIWELGVWEKLGIFYLLTAKTMTLLAPILILTFVLMAFELSTTAWIVFVSGWTLVFFWMSVDLMAFSLSGHHASDYFPNLYDMLKAPEKNFGNWVGSGPGHQIFFNFLVSAIEGIAGLWILRRLLIPVLKRLGGRYLKRIAIAAAVTYLLVLVCVFPVLTLLEHYTLLRRVFVVLPISTESLESVVDRMYAWLSSIAQSFGSDRDIGIEAVMPRPGDAGRMQKVVLRNRTDRDFDLNGWRLQNFEIQTQALTGVVKKGQSLTVYLKPDHIKMKKYGDELLLVDRRGWLRNSFAYKQEDVAKGKFVTSREGRTNSVPRLNLAEYSKSVDRRVVDDAINPKPIDETAVIGKGPHPNVVIILLESFRHSAFNPSLMKGVYEWSKRGLRLERHYSGGNSTQYGLFSLLYGRTATLYEAILDRRITPQLCESMKRSGYFCSFFTSTDYEGFRRLHDFLNEKSFHKCHIDKNLKYHDHRDWLEADLRSLSALGDLLKTRSKQPQFVVTLLYSTHYPYQFPKDYAHFKPCDTVALYGGKLVPMVRERVLNRYRNAARYMDHELTKFIESLDPDNNIVIITGDHGESIGEDGVLGHGSQASEIQMRVPFVIVGPGIEPRRIRFATGHIDVLPTLLHLLAGRPISVAHAHGRDLVDIDTPEVDEVMITPWRWRNHKELLLIRGRERALFKVHLTDKSQPIRFSCLLDEAGKIR